MSISPSVTVLMTVYNGLPYLRQAIESVLNQTFTDFEFLIIDDASTDDSVTCIRSFADPRIRLVCNERNLGQVRSLNRGLELARGPYIARLDQDDMCLPDRLRKQIAFLEERPDVAVVGTLMYSMNSDGRKMGLLGRKLDDYGTFVAWLLLSVCPVCHPSVMFRRGIIAHVGGYDESFAPAEDVDLWTKLAMRRYNARVIPEPLVMYRVHDGQQSVTKAATQRRNIQRAHDRLVEAFCNGSEARRVSLLLRVDDALWNECRSKEQLVAVVQALNDMLANMQTILQLSPQEFTNLTRLVYRRLGPGARLAPKMMHYPSMLFYLAFFLLSPLLVPKVRQALSRLAGKSRRLRRTVRLVLSSVGR